MANGESDRIDRPDPRFDALIPAKLDFEVVADFSGREGEHWLEGPVWDARQGCLFFSDVKDNAIHRWRPGAALELFMQPSGYTGSAPFPGAEPGANGLTIDAEGRLVMCEHGDRRVTRLEVDRSKTVLADRFQGKRFNSPNDLVIHSSGDVYFTDSAFGLPRQFDDPGRELSFCGVYRIATDGTVTLLLDGLQAPNGIALSPDETTLFVADGNRERSTFLAFPLRPDGSLGEAHVLLDVTGMDGYGGPDGLAVDHRGNLYAAARERVFVVAADGTHLGTLILRQGITTNLGWGEDGSALFVTTERRLLRLRLTTRGARF